MKIIVNLISLLSIFASALALAEADGPDYFRVHGVAANDILNIRSQADPHSEKLGEIPPGTDCVKNFGCKGGLTMDEFTNLSKKEQTAALKDHPRWCHIEYLGIKGWVSGRFLTEGSCDNLRN